ncbi:MAG: neutral/alkaline non-lysosomal ceramidase N-terminal domain-containing protein [Chloroflexi bacterium]|nr:neutral/alkaline non-lysosomal ceramidase N-terminal domain-containing protein [Chloroflexota bacterium]MCY3936966.1 neutral/alkaline non-lysosomal ceramidase N-terminal domain-containing protein [Chloroflexota bacterium]
MIELKAGVGRTDITPPLGIAHAGWGAQTHQRAEAVDMPLLCTALVVAKDDLELAIVDLDLIWLMPENDSAVRKAISAKCSIDPANIRISYSHTHSGPIVDFTWMTEGDELIPPYVAELPEKAAEAVYRAKNDMRPAHIGAGTGECANNVNRRMTNSEGNIFCGRNWDGFVDREVVVIAVDDLDEKPIATLVNYGCHGTTIGPPNRSVTPDFPGPMRQTVEQNIGGLCLFLQGATGNVGPVNGFTDDANVYRQAGHRLGIEAARVRLDIDPVPRKEELVRILPSGAELGIYEDKPAGEPDSSLAVLNTNLELPVKEYPPVSEAEAEFDSRKSALVEARKTGDQSVIYEAAWPARRAELALHHAKLFGGGKVDIWIQAMRLGPVALVATPLEPFAEIGAEVKQYSPAAHTAFSGYSNGYFGYMPMPDAYAKGGYEVTTSPYQPDAASMLVKACGEALKRLWD